MDDEQCSELFEKVFDSDCGGCVRMCMCGITHFDTYNDNDWEEGELEDLMVKEANDPAIFMGHDRAIGTMEVDGKDIVYGCTCDSARRYENFITQHAGQIATYLNGRAALMREKANEIEVQ